MKPCPPLKWVQKHTYGGSYWVGVAVHDRDVPRWSVSFASGRNRWAVAVDGVIGVHAWAKTLEQGQELAEAMHEAWWAENMGGGCKMDSQ